MNRPAADAVASTLLSEFQRILVTKGKVATRETYNSLESRIKTTGKGFAVEIWGGPGWRHIEKGKRANTKMPVKKVGETWVLLEPLASWKRLKAPNIPQFLFARGIARRARAGIPLTDPALERSWPRIEDRMAEAFTRGLLAELLRKK